MSADAASYGHIMQARDHPLVQTGSLWRDPASVDSAGKRFR
ncbi:hypothetical protein FRACA_180017 [Frankia canadensis]|uniref:Uncharacterized protein n=1 Tax=Frankia canadensis TaxID=1836972 RepID=A0A2I2KNK9_9ACTN|nr:hypothetical protein FRACA_180017 [Frankia canadensis]SOU54543.1 hypothetical protein FRACA_180017 [Frankia canadensis]